MNITANSSFFRSVSSGYLSMNSTILTCSSCSLNLDTQVSTPLYAYVSFIINEYIVVFIKGHIMIPHIVLELVLTT